MSDPLIQLRGLARSYDLGEAQVHALLDVDLEIERGESVAILGPSGSGKSTLLHLLGLLDTATSGSHRFGGVDVTNLDPESLARHRNRSIGFVFQRFHLVARLSALDNVAMPLKFACIPRRERRRRAAAMLERVGLGDRIEHRPAELSGGQQQRVAIARAIVNEPDLILADEPTGALDQSMGLEIMSLLAEIHANGATLAMVTHDEALASQLRRIVRMIDGRVVEDTAVVTPARPGSTDLS